MKTQDKSLSLYTENFIPKYIHESSPAFISFVKAYYDWAEQEGNLHNIMHAFGQIHNVEFTKEYYEKIKREYLNSLPDEFLIDDITFLRIAKQLYSSKGIPETIKFFFRALYNENVEILYPNTRSLLSNKRKEIYIRCVETNVLPSRIAAFRKLQNRFIRQKNGGMAFVESISFVTEQSIFQEDIINNVPIIGKTVFSIRISNKKFNDFFHNTETYLCDSTGKELVNDPDYITFKLENQLGNINLINGGINYVAGDYVFIDDTGFTETGKPIIERVRAKIAKVDQNGTITKITFDEPGLGHEEVYYTGTSVNGVGVGATLQFFPTAEFDASQNDLSVYSSDFVHRYTIRSAIPVTIWKNLLTNTVHPAGIEFDSIFGVVINEIVGNKNPIKTFTRTLSNFTVSENRIPISTNTDIFRKSITKFVSDLPIENREYRLGYMEEYDNRTIQEFNEIYENLEEFMKHYNTSETLVSIQN